MTVGALEILTAATDGQLVPSVKWESYLARGRVVDAAAPEVAVEDNAIVHKLSDGERTDAADIVLPPGAYPLPTSVAAHEVGCINERVKVAYSVSHVRPLSLPIFNRRLKALLAIF
jgi:hypothetical protein